MGWRFRRSISIVPGVRVNIGKTLQPSLSVGVRGAHVTLGKTGVRQSVGIPGTGLSYQAVIPVKSPDTKLPDTGTLDQTPSAPVWPQTLGGWVWLGLVVLGKLALFIRKAATILGGVMFLLLMVICKAGGKRRGSAPEDTAGATVVPERDGISIATGHGGKRTRMTTN